MSAHAFLVLAPLLTLSLAARAAASPAASEPTADRAGHPLVREDLEAFLDGLVPAQLEREDIAGAVVTVVKDGRILLAKGYGLADVATRRPVSGDATLFRVGSVSKLFTWTAVLQLVEQGKLELDREVSAYLDFPLVAGRGITLRHLLTHRPGYEDGYKDVFVTRAEDLRPLGLFLRTHEPTRIYEPGAVPAYSNYGAALAGYIVERVSGVPFDEYVRASILAPLGMSHSSFTQPLPGELAPLMASGYDAASKPPKPFEIVVPSPAGALSTSGEDMGRFMLAHLQDGRLGDARILSPETARLMHARAYGFRDELNGMALGFYEESRNGHRIIGHGGDTILFHSDLHLVPDAGFGFFVSYNSAGKGEVSPRRALWQKVLDRYFPWTPAAVSPLATAKADAQAVLGDYVSSRRTETGLLSATSLLGQVSVKDAGDGLIEVELGRDPAGAFLKYEEVAPLIFQAVHGQNRLAFSRLDGGRMILVPDMPIQILERSSGTKRPLFVVTLLALWLGVFGLTLVLWPVAALVRRQLRVPAPSREVRRARWVNRGAAALVAASAVSWGVFAAALGNDLSVLSTASTSRVRLLQALTVVAMVAALATLPVAVATWRRAGSWLAHRLPATLVGLAALAYVWTVLAFDLLRWGPGY
jgi:CubicO group peptidase (beta-lactamase class C family)